MKNNYKGDGLLFYNAVAVSKFNNEEIRKSMDVSLGTFYGLYKKTEFKDELKRSAAAALGIDVSYLFPVITNNIVSEHDSPGYGDKAQNNIVSGSNNDEDGNGAHGLLDDEDINNPQSMVNQILKIMDRQSIAADKTAEALLISARTADRLTSILDRITTPTEGERYAVKQTED